MNYREGNVAIKAIAGVVCAYLAGVSINTNALLIDNGSYITDTDAELDWLDSSYTIGKSYYQASTGFNTYLDGGWRYATNEEVANIFSQLFDGFYANNPYGSSYSGCIYVAGICDHFETTYTDQLADIYNFQSLFGFVQHGSGVTTEKFTYGLYGDEYIRKGFGGQYSHVNIMGTYDASMRQDNPATEVYGPESIGGAAAGSPWPINFTYAVRTHCEEKCARDVFVPEPPINLLMASGLIAIGILRRKRGGLAILQSQRSNQPRRKAGVF
jgi:hypothetical protein